MGKSRSLIKNNKVMKAKWIVWSMAIQAMVLSQSFGQSQSGKLNVVVIGIKEAKGNIRVGLFDKEENFLKKVVKGKTVKVDQDKITVAFEGVPPGEYAVSVIHDANENGELDSNFMGIPQEGFGFGNNAMGTFGPPSFEKAKIAWVGKDTSIEIKLKYY
jgi:uncharacterized protein (DUF2141 family)